MSVFGWIRDLLGIRKDIVETTKAQLEVKRLEEERRERESIKRPSLEEVKKYDPKTTQLFRKLEPREQRARRSPLALSPIVWLLLLLGIIAYLLLK